MNRKEGKMKKTFYVLLFVLLGLFSIGLGLAKNELFAEEKEYSFVVNLTVPEDTPVDSKVYFVGDLSGWGHLEDWILTKVEDGYKLEKTITTDKIETGFKFTLGDWAYEELQASGAGVDNRPLTLVEGETVTLNLVVEKWKAFPPVGPVEQIGTIIVHYQNWTGTYSDVGFHTWGQGTIDKKSYPALPTGTDEFGAYWEVPIAENADDQIGMIVLKSGMADGSQWDHKEYSNDIFIPTTTLKNKTETEIHVYYFQGGEGQIFIARQNRINVLVVYYDPSGSYEPNLGIHAWNGWSGAFDTTWDGSTEWGTPAKVFKEGLGSEGGSKGKVAMLYIDPESEAQKEWGAGCLIYAGDDDTKKTGDISDFKDLEPGTFVPIYVTGGNLYRGEGAARLFAENAFTFGFVPYDIETGKGTYAPKPTIIFVRLMLNVSIELEEDELIETRFILKQGNIVIPFEKINYNKSILATSEFVIYLKDENALDNTLEYTLTYSYGDDEATIGIDMDKEKPILTIVGEDYIEIKQGSKWDQALFPEIRAVDNRDGTISKMIFVKPGEGLLDTGVVGEYTITLTVADEWGNESQASFIINVIANDASNCNQTSTIFFINLLTVAAFAAFIFRKRNA